MRRKGFLFSISAVLLAFTISSLVSGYMLFLSQVEKESFASPGIQSQFLYIGSAFSKIIDMEIVILSSNSTETVINTSDIIPRDGNYTASVSAYETFINNHLNSGHAISANFSSFKAGNYIEFTGIGMRYAYGNSTKSNVTVNMTSVGNNSFVKKYFIDIGNFTSYTTSAHSSSNMTGDLDIVIRNSTSTIFNGSIDRTNGNTFAARTSGGKWINFTIGYVSGRNSSLLAMSEEKIYLNISTTINQMEIP